MSLLVGKALQFAFLTMCIVSIAKADTFTSESTSKDYESISLFTSAAQRQQLDSLRKQPSHQAKYISPGSMGNRAKQTGVNREKFFFKGFIRGASQTPDIMLQASDKKWLSKSEWGKIVEPVESGVRIKKHSEKVVLKPGQSIR